MVSEVWYMYFIKAFAINGNSSTAFRLPESVSYFALDVIDSTP